MSNDVRKRSPKIESMAGCWPMITALLGGNLYQVASEQYGDASKWTSIAAANALTDPQLNGIQTLTIPSSP